MSRRAFALPLLLALACRPADGGRQATDAGDARERASAYAGRELPTPQPKPDFVLTDTDGNRFDFRQRTDGYLTLLFFGYTHCPDVCPLHLSNIAAVLRRLPAGTADRVRVVFVTTDPERDTAMRIRTWLNAFDHGFIGLRGSAAEILRAETAAGVPPAAREPTVAPDTGYAVGHAAQVIAYGADNLARAVYPFGTRQEDWAHDLPLLLAAAHPAVEVRAGYAFAPPTPDEGAAYFTLVNHGDVADTLVEASVDGAESAAVHRQRQQGAQVIMEAAGAVPLPAHDSLALAPGGPHLMIRGFRHPVRAGDTLTLTLRFARAGRIRAALPVRPYGS